MAKIVVLDSVLKTLRDAANEANLKASDCAGVDDGADSYFQGLRNGYLQAAEFLEKNQDKLTESVH